MTADKKVQGSPCPIHSTLANGMRLFGAQHPCFTAYDNVRPSKEGGR